ncbi:MAG: hypothetical protein ACRENU_14220 [Gemmatimonadaceae bacterium]
MALVISLGLAGALVAAGRHGRNQLFLTAGAAAVVLLLLRYLDWRGQASVETPLSTYVLIAVLPTAIAAAVVAVLSGRQTKPAVQYSMAAAVSFILIGGSLLTAFYP